MATRHFTADYAERVVLKDGSEVVLRLVVPEDKEILRAGFERLSPESRYARFLAPKQRLTDEELAYLVEVDQETHFALGATREGVDGSPPIGLGIARFIRLPDQPLEPITAEAAIAVADEAQGLGLGRILFQRLVAAAVERGIERFRCEVLGTNSSMKNLIDQIAPHHKTEVGGGVMSIDFDLPETKSEERESMMYRFFRAAAENAVEWTQAVRKLWRGDKES